MNTLLMSTDSHVQSQVKAILGQHKVPVEVYAGVESFFSRAMEEIPRLVVLDYRAHTSLVIFDLIRDLRSMFGSILTICVLGNKVTGDEISHLLGVGADGFCEMPLDKALFEEFVRRNAYEDLCLPFKYRSVPSGGASVKVSCQINLKSLNKNGLVFYSDSFFTKGSIFTLSLNELLDIEVGETKVKIIKNTKLEDSDDFEYFGEFFEITTDNRKLIAHAIKLKKS